MNLRNIDSITGNIDSIATMYPGVMLAVLVPIFWVISSRIL